MPATPRSPSSTEPIRWECLTWPQIRERLDPGDPHRENMYDASDADLRAAGISWLPQNLGDAIDGFASDPLAKATFGDAMFDRFVAYKRQEWEAFRTHVSTWELERYPTFL